MLRPNLPKEKAPDVESEGREMCLAYFRAAISSPASVPPWSEWWPANLKLIERSFSLVDYVRLKHRRLRGARQILQLAGELAKDYQPPSMRETGTCPDCGERAVEREQGITCPQCGVTPD